jgi:hypothetical protein
LACALVPAIAFAGSNLVQNGDFEPGQLAPWQAPGTITVATTQAHGGGHSANSAARVRR